MAGRNGAAGLTLPFLASTGDQRELYLLDERPDNLAPNERRLGDAMPGKAALIAADGPWCNPDPVDDTSD